VNDPVLIFDTGVLYDLVSSPTLSKAACEAWAGRTMWVPPSVRAEIHYRIKVRLKSLPPQLPGRAAGLLTSKLWKFEVLDLSQAETAEVVRLQAALGGRGNAGECEAAVICARRSPDALVLIDDTKSLPVLTSYVRRESGASMWTQRWVEAALDLRDGRFLTDDQVRSVVRELRSNDRPYVDDAALPV